MKNEIEFKTIEELHSAYPYEKFKSKVRKAMDDYFKAFSSNDMDECIEENEEWVQEMYETHCKRFLDNPVKDFYRQCSIVAGDLRMMF